MRALLVAALALAGCGDLFDAKAPQGYACSSSGTCPPGQQCVPGEHVCRTPCTQTTMSGMTGNNGQCENLNTDGNQQSTGWACDYDHFCRPMCTGGGSGQCQSGCASGEVCDTSVSICRPACGDGCPSTWGCTDLSNNSSAMNGTPEICVACRPLATTTVHVPKFAPIVYYQGATSEQIQAIAVGDFTGNGHPSVAALDQPGGKVYVFANDGTAVLQPPLAYPASPKPFDLVPVDLNRDGKLDLVVGTVQSPGPGGGPVLLAGNGDNTFAPQVVGPMLSDVVLFTGDFDGDGKLDVGMCGGNGQLSIVTSDGTGGIKTLTSFTQNGGNPQFVRCGAADLNGDKKLDIWVDDLTMGVIPFLSNGANPPSFTQGQMSGFSNRISEVVFDYDGDGKPDIAVGEQAPIGAGGSPQSTLQLNKGMNGNFTTMTTAMIALPGMGPMVVADFDGDGHLDVAVFENSMNGKSNVDILSGDGKTLHYTETIAVAKASLAPVSIAVGDLDGDGKPDLVLGDGNGTVGVLLNQTPSP